MTTAVGILLHIGGLIQMVKDGKTLTADIIAGAFKPADVLALLKDAVALVGFAGLPAAATTEVTTILNSLITGLGSV